MMREISAQVLSTLTPDEADLVAERWHEIADDAGRYDMARNALADALGPDDDIDPASPYVSIGEHASAIGLRYEVASAARWAWAAVDGRDEIAEEQFEILTGPWSALP